MGTFFSTVVNSVVEFFIIFSILQSCVVFTQAGQVDPTIEPYYREFLYYTKRKRTSVVIRFGKLSKDDGAVGVCNYLLKTITIDREFWDVSNEIKRRALLWHELGHCDLFMGHKGGVYTDLCPKSLMNPYLPTDWCLNKYWESYKREFRKD